MANVDQTHGFWVDLKGKLKQFWGKSTGDRKTQVKGAVESAGGQIQKGLGDVREAIKGPNEPQHA